MHTLRLKKKDFEIVIDDNSYNTFYFNESDEYVIRKSFSNKFFIYKYEDLPVMTSKDKFLIMYNLFNIEPTSFNIEFI